MRKVKMRVRWIVEEVIEVTIADEALPEWSDRAIMDELEYSDLRSGKIAPPEPGGEFEDVDLAEDGERAQRQFEVVWGELLGT
jgi:hypothetical protein